MEPIVASFNSSDLNTRITKVKEQIVVLSEYHSKLFGTPAKTEQPDILSQDRPKALFELLELLETTVSIRNDLQCTCQRAIDEIESRMNSCDEHIKNFVPPKLASIAKKKA